MHSNLPSHFVGFDSLFRLMEDSMGERNFKYPPHDLVQFDDEHYRLTFAVAGFEEDELGVTAEGNKLRVTGQQLKRVYEEDEVRPTFLHKGISTRNFDQTFRLGPHIRVAGAELRDGLLHIDLEKVVPEEMKPRQITIKRPSNLLEVSED